MMNEAMRNSKLAGGGVASFSLIFLQCSEALREALNSLQYEIPSSRDFDVACGGNDGANQAPYELSGYGWLAVYIGAEAVKRWQIPGLCVVSAR